MLFADTNYKFYHKMKINQTQNHRVILYCQKQERLLHREGDTVFSAIFFFSPPPPAFWRFSRPGRQGHSEVPNTKLISHTCTCLPRAGKSPHLLTSGSKVTTVSLRLSATGHRGRGLHLRSKHSKCHILP